VHQELSQNPAHFFTPALNHHGGGCTVKNKRILSIAFLSLLILIICAAAPVTSRADDKAVLQVLAGAGLKDALNELKEIYGKKTGTEVRYSFAAAGILRKQIEEGVPADLFFTPGKKEMDDLRRQSLIIPETGTDILGNEIVLVIAKEKKGVIRSFADLACKAQSVSVGIPETVPAGKYARETLKSLGLWDKVEKRMLYAKDVRTVLAYVDSGNVDAGLVYRSDTAAMKSGTLAAAAPKGSHSPIRFSIAALKSTKRQQEAKQFIDFLKSPEASAIFTKYRFTPLFGVK
jgi:molybdate transport system substrate-binding protein